MQNSQTYLTLKGLIEGNQLVIRLVELDKLLSNLQSKSEITEEEYNELLKLAAEQGVDDLPISD